MTDKKPSQGPLVPAPLSPFDAELAKLEEPDEQERRVARRSTTDYNVACVIGPVSYNVEVSDISEIAARISIRSGVVPRLGQQVTLKLMNGTAIDATVIRSDGIETVLQFIEPVPAIDEKLTFDEMGAGFYGSVLRLQITKD